jgi:hypothetical protein
VIDLCSETIISAKFGQFSRTQGDSISLGVGPVPTTIAARHTL